MSVDTKMLMTYDWANKFSDWSSYDILNSVEKALADKYGVVKKEDTSDFHTQYIKFLFDDGIGNRTLWLFRTSDGQNDKEFLENDKKWVTFSLGYWGNAVEIMETIAVYLTQRLPEIHMKEKYSDGRLQQYPISNIQFYLDKSDSDDEGYKLMEIK